MILLGETRPVESAPTSVRLVNENTLLHITKTTSQPIEKQKIAIGLPYMQKVSNTFTIIFHHTPALIVVTLTLEFCNSTIENLLAVRQKGLPISQRH